MDSQCYPISTLPGTTPLFRDFAEHAAAAHAGGAAALVSGESVFDGLGAALRPTLDAAHREPLADALRTQAENFGAGEAVFANIERLRAGRGRGRHRPAGRCCLEARC